MATFARLDNKHALVLGLTKRSIVLGFTVAGLNHRISQSWHDRRKPDPNPARVVKPAEPSAADGADPSAAPPPAPDLTDDNPADPPPPHGHTTTAE